MRCVQPIYPGEAKRRGIEGSVVLDVTVSERGNVTSLRLVSGNETLAKAAITAVRQWIYDPYPLDHPGEFKTRATLAFAPPAN
jgi:TonB family protein